MTENDYAHLLSLYYSLDFCMCMSFQEFLTRFSTNILEVRPHDKTR